MIKIKKKKKKTLCYCNFFFQKIFASVHHVNIAKRCRGIRIVRPSPNHRFVAVATYNGKNRFIFISEA